jgi:ubiquinone/menaquinone biosynthesis C-methylase UbiE
VATTLKFDAEAARRVEAVYLTADVVAQRREVLRLLAPQPGDHVLDIGSGPGLLAADIARAVGRQGRVCGIDLSDDMIAIARARPVPDGAATVEYRNGTAEDLPHPDASFDLAVSTQVLEYVPNVAAALAEARRVLRPGGRLLVLDTDWDSIVWHSRDPARMRRVLTAWEQHLVDPHLPRSLSGALRAAGFAVATPTVLPLFNHGYDTTTYSAGLIDIIARFVPGRDDLTTDHARAWADDLRSLGPDYFFSLNRYLFRATRSA